MNGGQWLVRVKCERWAGGVGRTAPDGWFLKQRGGLEKNPGAGQLTLTDHLP